MPQTIAPNHDAVIRNAGTWDLPAMPQLLTDLSNAVERDDVTMEQIAALVEADPGLAAAVVQSSNSAFHAPRSGQAITSVREAITVLGLKSLVALATGAFLRRAFPGSTQQVEMLWSRSTALAEACVRIAQETHSVSRDVAYTFGLFRFVGCAVLLMQAPGYKKTFEHLELEGFAQKERASHGITHAQVGAGLVVRWGMSKVLVEAVGNAADLELLAHLPVEAEARRVLAVGALAQLEQMPTSVVGPQAVFVTATALINPQKSTRS